MWRRWKNKIARPICFDAQTTSYLFGIEIIRNIILMCRNGKTFEFENRNLLKIICKLELIHLQRIKRRTTIQNTHDTKSII